MPLGTPELIIILVVALLIFDVMRGREGDFPRWYPPLRAVLTLGVATCLGVAALYRF